MSYAAKAGREVPYATGKPIFIKHKDIPSVYEKVMTNEDMYKSLLRSVQGREIKGGAKDWWSVGTIHREPGHENKTHYEWSEYVKCKRCGV